MLNGLSPRRSPYLTERRPASPSTDTTPFDTVRLPICTPSRAEDMSSSAWRASAAAARTCGPPRWIDEIELVACDLQQPGGIALAELALAEVDRRGVVGMDRDPRIDRVRIGRARDVAARRRGRPGKLHCAEIEADDERAAALDETAARERGLGEE